jgi:hypothetical protein
MSEQNRNDIPYGGEAATPEQEQALRSTLTDAYSTAEPSDRLIRRVQEMATAADRRPARRFPELRPARLGWAMALILVVGVTLAYRWFFYRPGEAAVQLVPQNALMVMTVDLVPSAGQIPLFRRIGEAIKNEGLQEKIDGAVTEGLEKSPVGREIRPYVATSLALAMIDPSPQPHFEKAQHVILLKVNNHGKVSELLAKYGAQGTRSGLTYYGFKKDNFSAALIGEYLVLSPAVDLLVLVSRTHAGQVNSVAYLHEYQLARSELPEDANMMLFLSPTALATLDQESKQLGVNPLRQSQWMAVSATLRDQGVMFHYRLPMDSKRLQGLRAMASIAPIDEAQYSRLPSGAYGLFAISQPSKYWSYVEDAVDSEGGARQELDKGLAEFEKETGISVPRDILPALNGTLWMAVYPDPGKPDGVQGLMIIDDTNGADPVQLAEKIKAMTERMTADKGKPGVRFTSQQRDGATIWRLDEQSRKELTSDLKEAFGGRSKQLASPKGGPKVQISVNEEEDATITYAQVGKAILIASSPAMLERAVAVYQGNGPSLAQDAAFTNMRQNALPGSQSVLMVNLGSILERLRPTMEKATKDGELPFRPDEFIRLFGGPDNGLIASGKYDGRIATGTFFLPLNYETVVHMLAEGSKMVEGGDDEAPVDTRHIVE